MYTHSFHSGISLVETLVTKFKGIRRQAIIIKPSTCAPLSPLLRYMNPPGQETTTKIVSSMTDDPVTMYYTNTAGEVTACLTTNPTLKFTRSSSHILLNVIETDRIFTFARDENGKIVGCSSVDEVVKYGMDERRKPVDCLTTDSMFSFERDEDGYIVGFSVEYIRDVEENKTGISKVNKEFVFVRDETGHVEGCMERVNLCLLVICFNDGQGSAGTHWFINSVKIFRFFVNHSSFSSSV